MVQEQKAAVHCAKLLDWYDREARNLPWRYRPDDLKGGARPDPYRIWLSEIMLQQTTVKAVIPYFENFLALWPTVHDLASAPLDDVLTQWAGLGYYARARNLHKCATVIVHNHGGTFPENEAGLLRLPGIGPYTAAAIASIAFGQRAVVVDGNVERVVSRLFQVEQPLPDSKARLKELAGELTPDERPGDYAQAMMDLGAVTCTTHTPTCLLCPVSSHCMACASGIAAQLPHRKKKAAKPRRTGACFFALDGDGHILLGKRPDKGLLAKMAEIPGTDWITAKAPGEKLSQKALLGQAPFPADWFPLAGRVQHTFTHFHLELTVFIAETAPDRKNILEKNEPGHKTLYWARHADLDSHPLPSVMKKVIAHAESFLQTRPPGQGQPDPQERVNGSTE